MDPIYYLTGMKSLELTDEGLRGTSSIRLRPTYYGTAEQCVFITFLFYILFFSALFYNKLIF